ncbi:hypothetical protein ACP4OV_024291 [Aristida adscensionis]
MAPTLRRRDAPLPEYGATEFTMEVHHGGFFVGQREHRAYCDQKVDWFDHCEVDTWSPLWFDDFVVQLGHEKTNSLKFYWLLPGRTLADGLRIIAEDSDTLVMASMVDRYKNLVYFDHDDNVGGDWDDVIANPVCSLPRVFSPKRVND